MTKNNTNPYQPPKAANGGLEPAEGRRPTTGDWVISILVGLSVAALAFFATCFGSFFALAAIFEPRFGSLLDRLVMLAVFIGVAAALAVGLWAVRANLRLYAKRSQSND